MLLVEDSSVLLQARCHHCTSGVGVCGRISGLGSIYILSLLTCCSV